MDRTEETIEATLDSNGQLSLSHPSHLPAGPVRVTIRSGLVVPRRGVADVIREIAARQRAEGFPGRSAAELQAEEEAQIQEDLERDRKLDAARGVTSSGSP